MSRKSNTVTRDELDIDAERQLERALIRLRQLPQEAIDAIASRQRSQELSFAEAAQALGYATTADVEAAQASCRKMVVVEKPPLKPGAALTLAHDPFHPHSEKIRALRTELMLRHDNKRANVLAVVSPRAREGRSVLAAELALAFAQLGKPTLLVDADLRRPGLHRLFNADNANGLSQALAGHDAQSHVHPVDGAPQLGVLTSGAVSDNPLERLSDGHFEALVRQWRRRYEHIVIDTSPVADYSDALAVATVVGRVVMVSRACHTPYDSTRDLLRRLTATQSQVLGAVINHF